MKFLENPPQNKKIKKPKSQRIRIEKVLTTMSSGKVSRLKEPSSNTTS